MFKKKFFAISGSLALSFGLAGAVVAQDSTTSTMTTTTVKQTVQNADGTYTVIEYPVDKEVMVDLTPGANMSSARGMAHVMRRDGITTVNLDLTGLPSDNSNYYVYAVDPSGAATLLGPANIANGTGRATFTTAMNKFMLVLSPTQGLSTIASDTPITFRSAVPQGYAVVANTPTTPTDGMEKQVAGSAPVSSSYEVPLLGIPALEKGETEIRIAFSGELQGLKGKAYIDTSKVGVTKIKMRFDDMKLAPKQKRYVLWAVSPTKEYTKIGQVVNVGERQESEIRGETALKDFGLFVTVEDKEVSQPTSTIYSSFSVGR